MRRIVFICVLLLSCIHCNAQRWSVSTNLIDWAALGTVNVEGSVAVSRHWSVDAEWSYNPWTYKDGRPDQFQNRSLTGSLGTRWWPWHVFAGWWVSGSAQYQVYNRGGLLSDTAEEADAYGVGAGFGYALLIGEHINFDFGIGLWGGRKDYVTYQCTNCGRITDSGTKWFLMPDDIMVSITFIF